MVEYVGEGTKLRSLLWQYLCANNTRMNPVKSALHPYVVVSGSTSHQYGAKDQDSDDRHHGREQGTYIQNQAHVDQ